jgi:hypothetical protein
MVPATASSAGRTRADCQPQVGLVDTWIELTDVELPYVSFSHTFRFWADGTELTSDSTLRFRARDEVAEALDAAGLRLREIRDAPVPAWSRVRLRCQGMPGKHPLKLPATGGSADMRPCGSKHGCSDDGSVIDNEVESVASQIISPGNVPGRWQIEHTGFEAGVTRGVEGLPAG